MASRKPPPGYVPPSRRGPKSLKATKKAIALNEYINSRTKGGKLIVDSLIQDLESEDFRERAKARDTLLEYGFSKPEKRVDHTAGVLSLASVLRDMAKLPAPKGPQKEEIKEAEIAGPKVIEHKPKDEEEVA